MIMVHIPYLHIIIMMIISGESLIRRRQGKLILMKEIKQKPDLKRVMIRVIMYMVKKICGI